MPFINPYNFIPLRGEREKKSVDEYYKNGEALMSGKLVCRLVAKTPILLPDHENKKAKAYNGENYDEFPFMTVGGRPMIPGSSIRGVIRSIFEALTDSCVFTNDNYYFSSRTNEAKKPGLLEKTASGWILHEAVRYADRESFIPDTAQSGSLIKFSSYTDNKGKLYVSNPPDPEKRRQGYVLKMNPMRTTRGFSAPSIFELKSGGDKHELDPKYIDAFKENLNKYSEGAAGEKAKQYIKKYQSLRDGEMIPVWYETSSGGYYLALSQLSRNVYTKKPNDLLPENLKTCTGRENLCAACALFGFVSNSKNEDGAMGSRIRFSDAWPFGGVDVGESILLPILSSPRSSSLEFYLRHERDFYHADTPGVSLSGRKFYWHRGAFDLRTLKADAAPKMTSFMQPLTKGEFEFSIYFDQITKTQLNQLYTAITFGENTKDSAHCHKVGHGKPLGFGSAKIIVTEACIRDYKENQYTAEKPILDKIEAVDIPEVILRASDYQSTEGARVDYPRVIPNGDIFKWFAKNRPPSGQGRAKFFTKLPLANSKDIRLPDDPKDGNFKGSTSIEEQSMPSTIRITRQEESKPPDSEALKDLPKKVRHALNASVLNNEMKHTLAEFVSDAEANPGKYAKFEKEVNKAKKKL